jgi:hypothetical protein
MKEQIRLYKKLIYIFIPVIILVIFFEVKARNIQNGFSMKKNLLEKNIENIDILVLGTSHGYFSINTEIISDKSFNLAMYSQDLYYDFMLLDKYKEKLKNLKCVILTISYFSLWYDLGGSIEKWRKYFYKEYFGIKPKSRLSFSDIIDVKSYSFAFFYRFENVLISTINPKLFISGCNMNTLGWNTDTTSSSMDSTEMSMLKGKGRFDCTDAVINKDNFKDNIKLIDEFIKYANDNNIKLIFITTPVSYIYNFYVDQNNCNEFQKYINRQVDNKNIFYLNYFIDKRFSIKDFYDTDHLNGNAGMKFSRILKDTLESLNLYKSE